MAPQILDQPAAQAYRAYSGISAGLSLVVLSTAVVLRYAIAQRFTTPQRALDFTKTVVAWIWGSLGILAVLLGGTWINLQSTLRSGAPDAFASAHGAIYGTGATFLAAGAGIGLAAALPYLRRPSSR